MPLTRNPQKPRDQVALGHALSGEVALRMGVSSGGSGASALTGSRWFAKYNFAGKCVTKCNLVTRGSAINRPHFPGLSAGAAVFRVTISVIFAVVSLGR